jgi:hypothetical protein
MKMISMFFLVMISFSQISCAADVDTKKEATKKEIAGVPTSSTSKAPCDTKEDVLKKSEEEKKKLKPFSLQGGNTGCSVNEKK